MTEQDLQIIETYLNGKLTGEEQGEFLSRIKEDPEFKSTVSQMKASIAAIRQAVLDEKLALLKLEEVNLAKVDHSPLRITPLYKWVALAAVLIAAVVLIRPLIKPQDEIKNLYLAEHFDEYILHDTHKGTLEDSIYLQILRGYNLFAEKEFEKAIPILRHNWETHRDTMSLFYLWVTAVGMDNSQIQRQYEKEIMEVSSTSNKYAKHLNLLIEN